MKHIYLCILALTFAMMSLSSASSAVSYEDAVQESDKDYISGGIKFVDPIRVVFVGSRDSKPQPPSISYPWEKSIFKENYEDSLSVNGALTTEMHNNATKRTVEIEWDVYRFLVDFMDACDVYLTKRVPDLRKFYDLSNDARWENKLLVESYYYFDSIIKAHEVLSVDRELKIGSVTKKGGVTVVAFSEKSVLHTTDGEQGQGGDCVAYLANTAQGVKMLKFWVNSGEFETMRIKLVKGIKPKTAKTAGSAFTSKLLADYEANKEANLTKKPVNY